MEFTFEEAMQFIGIQSMNNMRLTRANAQQAARIAELEAKYEPKAPSKPELREVANGDA